MFYFKIPNTNHQKGSVLHFGGGISNIEVIPPGPLDLHHQCSLTVPLRLCKHNHHLIIIQIKTAKK